MKRKGDLRRVLADLSHGGHAVVDSAPEAKDAVRAGATPLSEVIQTPEVAVASSAEALQIVGTTSFDYLFPELLDPAVFADTHLPAGTPAEIDTSVEALNDLGAAMVEQNPAAPQQNSPIPPILTYWGQFVDHDLTANTDRDNVISIEGEPLPPLPPDDVRNDLKNLRDPALNLDSVYGDGPFTPAPAGSDEFVPYDGIKLRLGTLTPVNAGVRIPPVDDMSRDLPRIFDPADVDRHAKAQIGDGRNDENLVVAQLHVAFLRFHNAAVDWVRANEPERTGDGEIFSRARDLTRWTYQWLTVHDFLATVTSPGTVDRVLTADDDLLDLDTRGTYMPLEFSVAAYRFGHTMIRGAYDWNRNFGLPGNNLQSDATFVQLFQFTGKARPTFAFGLPTLPTNWPVEWSRFVDPDSIIANRFARRIDTQLAPPLADLLNEGNDPTLSTRVQELLKHLARRNLLRGFRLSLPTGQAVAEQLGVDPLTQAELETNSSQAVKDALTKGGFFTRTPLWFYVLKESEVRSQGNTLGEVGSEVVASTIIGQIKHDPRSYLQQSGWTPSAGVRLPNGSPVRSIADFLRFAGVL